MIEARRHAAGVTVGDGRPGGAQPVLRASRRLEVLEHFRVPYAVAAGPAEDAAGDRLGWIVPVEEGPCLLWPGSALLGADPVAAVLRRPDAPDLPLFAALVGDDAARGLLPAGGGCWERIAEVAPADGGSGGASIWRREDGSLFLPFDPDEVRRSFLTERYRSLVAGSGGRGWRRAAMHAYYRARGLLPRPLQIWLRRRYARIQARTAFPRWPCETALHDFLDLFLALAQSICPEPVPTIAPWPGGAAWALVLTHDVETAVGVRAMERVVDLERGLGLRSCWNLVPRRDYEVPDELVGALAGAGFEVGVHGLYHDGRDLESLATLLERLPGIREAAERWNAVGFRSPATHRDWELMPMLGFDYDSSYPDADPFEPQGGGCCTWLPFALDGDVVELPLTMPQDHTLFVILRHEDERPWVEKAEVLRQRGGMALLDTHPDYLTDERVFAAYRRLLERYARDETAWRALPAEVSAWWRRRAASTIERDEGGWRVVGPAAGEGEVRYAPTAASGGPLGDHPAAEARERTGVPA